MTTNESVSVREEVMEGLGLLAKIPRVKHAVALLLSEITHQQIMYKHLGEVSDRQDQKIGGLGAENDRLKAELSRSKSVNSELGADQIIKAAVNKFLGWKLPQSFNPDCGISIDREVVQRNCWPNGTNLFDAEQAEAMFTYCLSDALAQQAEQLKEAQALIASLQAKAPRWISMESAPKDRDILLSWDGRTVKGCWLDNSTSRYMPWAGWKTPSNELAPKGQPHAWMEIPAPSTPATDEVKCSCDLPLSEAQIEGMCTHCEHRLSNEVKKL